MEVTLEFITPDAEAFIGKMAGICYSSNSERETCIKRAAKCAKEGHLATLRFAHAIFNVKGISRVCSHQFVRSAHLDFLQRSQRYCKEEVAAFTVPPSADARTRDVLVGTYAILQETYKDLIRSGVKKEDARFVLPEATHTEMNVVGNLQAWKDFITLRADPHAQWEIRQVAKEINNKLSEHCPNLFPWMP